MNAKALENIKTEYLKEKIKGLKLTDQTEFYIGEMIWLENAIINGGVTGWAGNVKYWWMKEEHRDEYLGMLEEVDSERADKERKRIRAEKLKALKDDLQYGRMRKSGKKSLKRLGRRWGARHDG